MSHYAKITIDINNEIFATIPDDFFINVLTSSTITQINIQVSDYVPGTSYMKLIDVWYVFCIVTLFCIIVALVIVNFIQVGKLRNQRSKYQLLDQSLYIIKYSLDIERKDVHSQTEYKLSRYSSFADFEFKKCKMAHELC